MNNFFFCTVLTAISLHCHQLLSVTITASEFNQLYSCQDPFRPTETSTIILNENIIINGLGDGCEPIVPGPGFNIATDVVIFTSSDNHSVIIDQSELWFVALNITFSGNAQLLTRPGSILALVRNNPILCMSENSKFIPQS